MPAAKPAVEARGAARVLGHCTGRGALRRTRRCLGAAPALEWSAGALWRQTAAAGRAIPPRAAPCFLGPNTGRWFREEPKWMLQEHRWGGP